MENSSIQWTKHTWNPLIGCRKVSKGCKYCYAELFVENRMGRKFEQIRVASDAVVKLPYKLHRSLTGMEEMHERLVFTCSLSDFFIEEGDEIRPYLWKIIRETPNLIYQILTKRPERIKDNLPADWGDGYKNVWLGVTAEDQHSFNLRVPILSEIPAAIRFLSMEPLLERVDIFSKYTKSFPTARPLVIESIHWIIVGGESGFNDDYRPCEIDWMLEVIDACSEASIPVFVKQVGTHIARKRFSMLDRKGGNIDELPPYLKIRQFPIL